MRTLYSPSPCSPLCSLYECGLQTGRPFLSISSDTRLRLQLRLWLWLRLRLRLGLRSR